jgi:hypothetical protein
MLFKFANNIINLPILALLMRSFKKEAVAVSKRFLIPPTVSQLDEEIRFE